MVILKLIILIALIIQTRFYLKFHNKKNMKIVGKFMTKLPIIKIKCDQVMLRKTHSIIYFPNMVIIFIFSTLYSRIKFVYCVY